MTTPEPATQRTNYDAISRRAAEFYQRRRFWKWNAADQAELDAWLAESMLNRAAFLRVQAIAARATQLASLRPFRFGGARKRPGWKIARRFALPLLAAASIAAVAVFAVPYMEHALTPPDRTYSTELGGRTLLTFADHTQVELNTDTVARFRMTNRERTVWLEKGEAWFRVSHNAANPFSVIVGKHRITDLGTEFLVRREPSELEVALLNGRAALSSEGAPVATLVPGDDAVARGSSMTVVRKTPRELADKLAWRRGILVFRNVRLGEAAAEFNRYNATKIVIADPAIADLTFSAEIRNDNLEGFVQLAQTMLKLHADWEANDIVLSRDAREKIARPAHSKRGQ